MILVIVAAGRGKRLKKNIPKCLTKIKNISIIERLEPFIKMFKKTIIVTGYKDELIRKKLKKNKKVFFVKNKNFKKSNMVYSMFCAKKFIPRNCDIVLCYSDIIFDSKIYYNFKKHNFSFIPIKTDWLKIWKKRMAKRKIKLDAENLIIEGKSIVTIGTKITSSYPKYQFMGLMKIKHKDYIFMENVFKKIKNMKIDFTNFINILINKYSFYLRYKKTSLKWFEVDTLKDLKFVEKEI